MDDTQRPPHEAPSNPQETDMTHPSAGDNFYGICGVAAALIVAVALGLPALNAPASDEQAVSQPVPVAAAERPVRAAAEAVEHPRADLPQPATSDAYGG
jgi:hypothetical protein